MYKRKIGLAIVLIVAAFGLYFTYIFYRVFFLPNTTFENRKSYVFISTGSDIDALLIELAPLIKSTDDFALWRKRKAMLDVFELGIRLTREWVIMILLTARGKSLPVRVTFNNQERLEDLAGRLAQQLETDSLAFLNQMRDADFLTKNGFDQATALAMYIPNTYEFFGILRPNIFKNAC